MEVAHGRSLGFARTGRDPGGRSVGHSSGTGEDVVDRSVVQPSGDAVHFGQLRGEGTYLSEGEQEPGPTDG